MERALTVYCDDDLARAVAGLAREYGVPEGEIGRQLLELGLAELEGDPRLD